MFSQLVLFFLVVTALWVSLVGYWSFKYIQGICPCWTMISRVILISLKIVYGAGTDCLNFTLFKQWRASSSPSMSPWEPYNTIISISRQHLNCEKSTYICSIRCVSITRGQPAYKSEKKSHHVLMFTSNICNLHNSNCVPSREGRKIGMGYVTACGFLYTIFFFIQHVLKVMTHDDPFLAVVNQET